MLQLCGAAEKDFCSEGKEQGQSKLGGFLARLRDDALARLGDVVIMQANLGFGVWMVSWMLVEALRVGLRLGRCEMLFSQVIGFER